MAQLKFNAASYTLREYESVLDCLLRNGQAIPYACKAGMCQACLIRAVDCQATPESSKWIKPTLQEKGYTLACQWVPVSDVGAALPGVEEFSVPVCIAELSPLNAKVLRVRLQVQDRSAMFAYRPGQYLTLINPAGIARSYSIANDFERDGFVELHVGGTAQGLFTRWLFSEAREGCALHMRGPAGACFYSPLEGREHPLLLAGTGTGLAPLYGIVNDALRQGHAGPIHLWHGGRTPAHLYYRRELEELARTHHNFFYHGCVVEQAGQPLPCGRLENLVEQSLDTATLPHTRIYLCGAPDFVHGMRKRIFLKGARSAHIHCDPFTERSIAV